MPKRKILPEIWSLYKKSVREKFQIFEEKPIFKTKNSVGDVTANQIDQDRGLVNRNVS